MDGVKPLGNGILVLVGINIAVTFTYCRFYNITLGKPSLFHSAGNNTLLMNGCVLDKIVSSCVNGSVYSSVNYTYTHNFVMLNSTIGNVEVLSSLFGGVVYFVSSSIRNVQKFINCTIENINVSSNCQGGVFYFGSAPSEIEIVESVMMFIRKGLRGGGIFLDFSNPIAKEWVCVRSVFKSIEVSAEGGGIFSRTNVWS
jgi:hypothetical protein